MKVLLVNPNYITQVYGEETLDYLVAPLGLSYIAAVLKRDGVDVNLLEANALSLSMDDIEKEIRRQKPDLVGITGTTPLAGRVEEIARRAKSVNRGIKVVVGGPHATILPKEVLKNPDIDFCVCGEGEVTALELVKALDKGSDLNGILGLGFKTNGQVQINGSRPLIKDLDSLPLPARELLPMEKYIFPLPTGKVAQFTNLISSRGCPYLCTFCGQHNIWTRLVRFRSPKNVVDEIQEVKEKYGVSFVGFTDSNFPLNRKITLDICDEILARGIKIKWACGSRVDLVDQELLQKMHQSGCQQINFGVESGNAEILKAYKKGITLEQAKTAIKQAKKAGLKVYTYFMVGGPGETRETAEETIKLAKKLDPDYAQFSVTTPFPGTELFEMADMGGALGSFNWSQFLTYQAPVFATKNLSATELEELKARAFRSFYFRPSFILKKALQIRSLSDIKVLFKGFRFAIKLGKGKATKPAKPASKTT